MLLPTMTSLNQFPSISDIYNYAFMLEAQMGHQRTHVALSRLHNNDNI
jgi:hypothetical protein